MEEGGRVDAAVGEDLFPEWAVLDQGAVGRADAEAALESAGGVVADDGVAGQCVEQVNKLQVGVSDKAQVGPQLSSHRGDGGLRKGHAQNFDGNGIHDLATRIIRDFLAALQCGGFVHGRSCRGPYNTKRAMPSVCLYFQVHQPVRLRRYSVFDSGTDYFDETANREICLKVASRCYLPATTLLLDLIKEYAGRFRVALSITGCALEQFQQYSPEVLDAFKALVATGCVEMLCETYYHSLAHLYSWDEFKQQVETHRAMVKTVFGQEPKVFRGTELVYSNDLGRFAGQMGFTGALAEGADRILGARSPNVLYRGKDEAGPKLLLKNYRLSDDIAFRFSNRAWEQWPLTTEKFARWVNQINGNGDVCDLFIDLETLGEHQWAETGIFEFMRYLPRAILATKENDFVTPSEAIARYPARDVFDAPDPISWADTERDLSAWTGNAMQEYAMRELFKMEAMIKSSPDPQLLRDWRLLTTSDHFYYMSTKYFADGDVHKYFSPYESPYDSYINYMNVLDSVGTRARGGGQQGLASALLPG